MTAAMPPLPPEHAELQLVYALESLHIPLASQAADAIRANRTKIRLLEAKLTLAERSNDRRAGSIHTFHPQTAQEKESQA